MSKLILNRWLRWSLFGAVLVALGCGIHHVQPHEALCEIPNAIPSCFAAQGRKLMTRSIRGVGPIVVWDTRTGREILRLPTKELKLHINALAVSANGRYIGVEITEYGPRTEDGDRKISQSIFVLDMIADTVRELPLVDTFGGDSLTFSPSGDLLVRPGAIEQRQLRIWDTKTGGLVDQRSSCGPVDGAGDVFVHTVSAKKHYCDAEIWSFSQRKPVALFHQGGVGGWCDRAGNFFIGNRLTPDGVSSGRWCVWSLKSSRLEAEFDSKAEDLGDVSGDGRWLALLGKDAGGRNLELRELPSGKIARVLRPEGFTFDWVRFSPDGKFLLASNSEYPYHLAVVDVPAMKTLWKVVARSMPSVHFSPDSSKVHVIMFDDLLSWDCLDCATGTRVATMAWPRCAGDSIEAAVDGRTFLAHRVGRPKSLWPDWLPRLPWPDWPAVTQTDTFIVIDAETCRERFRLRSHDVASYLLSDDGRTLATEHNDHDGEHVLRCWDVEGCKPLRWSIGVPAGLGAACILFAWRRGRRRKEPAKST